MSTNLETKTAALVETKMVDEGHGYLEGYASVKGNRDSYGDVIEDGAYQGLEEFKSQGWSGFNHSDKPVGYIVDAREDSKGLWVKIAFHGTASAQEVRQVAAERLAAGKDVGMSIMYRTLEQEYKGDGPERTRYLKKISVVEAGFVAYPANPAATVTNVKTGSGTRLDDQMKAALEQATDLNNRLADLREKRQEAGNDLSPERKAQVAELAALWADLAAACLDEKGATKAEATPIPDEDLRALAPTW